MSNSAVCSCHLLSYTARPEPLCSTHGSHKLQAPMLECSGCNGGAERAVLTFLQMFCQPLGVTFELSTGMQSWSKKYW